MPKLYFYDTGLACSLLGLENSKQLNTHYLKGSFFENLAILEILKARIHQGLPVNLYFWRDRTGHEVDLIGEWGGCIHAFEVKLSSTFQDNHIKNIRYFLNLCQQSTKEKALGYLIYTGSHGGLHQDVALTPLNQIHEKIVADDKK